MTLKSHFSTRSAVRRAVPFRWMCAAACVLALMSYLMIWFDVAIAKLMKPEYLRGDVRRILKLSEFFAHGFCVLVIAWVTWQMAPHLRRHLLRLVMCVVWPPLIVHGLKAIVVRFRPTNYLDQQLIPHFPSSSWETWQSPALDGDWNVIYQSQSFPSAHVAAVCGLAIGMCWMYPKGKQLFILLAVLSSIQRIAFFAHWPSDVLAAAAIAFLISGGLVQNWGLGYLMGKFEREAETAQRP